VNKTVSISAAIIAHYHFSDKKITIKEKRPEDNGPAINMKNE
jgi:hypothetical protein